MREAISASKVCDIAVIGGGNLRFGGYGSRCARWLSSVGLDLTTAGGQGRYAENQGWLQSGLMYVDRFKDDRKRGRRLAAQMYAAGLAMLTTLGLPHPGEGGRAVIKIEGTRRKV